VKRVFAALIRFGIGWVARNESIESNHTRLEAAQIKTTAVWNARLHDQSLLETMHLAIGRERHHQRPIRFALEADCKTNLRSTPPLNAMDFIALLDEFRLGRSDTLSLLRELEDASSKKAIRLRLLRGLVSPKTYASFVATRLSIQGVNDK
jgi:hypothetical protein